MMQKRALYRNLADTLRAAIAAGEYRQGDFLPTELALCMAHNVSRHTVRDALRLLTQEGLVTRTRGIGTIVTGTSPMGRFSQDWGEIGDILQYARDTRLVITYYGPAQSHHLDVARLLGPEVSTPEWKVVEGVRQRLAGGPILALTTICVRADLMPAREILEDWPHAIGEYIATNNQLRATRIEQEISAILLSAPAAKTLSAQKGDPALATLRRYFDAGDQVFLASFSIHPADRFNYKMKAER